MNEEENKEFKVNYNVSKDGKESEVPDSLYPGVSGKTQRGGTWFNRKAYDEQRSFMGMDPKGYRRSDDRIYDEVYTALKKSPDVDETHIGVQVHEGQVNLSGWVHSRQSKRLAEYLVEDLPGVEAVMNELRVVKEDDIENSNTI
ncbi:MAG TPA: BON domain-containing protein [Bacteriovoracaceae bacterium]|nr:BON domain-containing protein [Bacteriovoracaceae bacterium]